MLNFKTIISTVLFSPLPSPLTAYFKRARLFDLPAINCKRDIKTTQNLLILRYKTMPRFTSLWRRERDNPNNLLNDRRGPPFSNDFSLEFDADNGGSLVPFSTTGTIGGDLSDTTTSQRMPWGTRDNQRSVPRFYYLLRMLRFFLGSRSGTGVHQASNRRNYFGINSIGEKLLEIIQLLLSHISGRRRNESQSNNTNEESFYGSLNTQTSEDHPRLGRSMPSLTFSEDLLAEALVATDYICSVVWNQQYYEGYFDEADIPV